MGYTTEFKGHFNITPALSQQDNEFLTKLSNTRRMARNVGAKYGIEGEWYVDGQGFYGQDHEDNIIDYNQPPRTQPGLWLQWEPNKKGTKLKWNGAEKFYNYVEWLEYLNEKFFKPKGYMLDGKVKYRGEDMDDNGFIVIDQGSIHVFSHE